MARTNNAAATQTDNTQPREAKLKLVPPPLPTRVDPMVPRRGLLLQGFGHPNCPELFVALEAMQGVAHVLRGAMERAGRIGEEMGEIEKSWTYRRDEKIWYWKVSVAVPNSITATALEVAKHLAGRSEYLEAISLVPLTGYPAD